MLQVMFLCYGFLKCKPTMRSLSYSFVTNVLQSILLKYASIIKADVWGWWGFFDLFCTEQIFFICSIKCFYCCIFTRCMFFLLNDYTLVNLNDHC